MHCNLYLYVHPNLKIQLGTNNTLYHFLNTHSLRNWYELVNFTFLSFTFTQFSECLSYIEQYIDCYHTDNYHKLCAIATEVSTDCSSPLLGIHPRSVASSMLDWPVKPTTNHDIAQNNCFPIAPGVDGKFTTLWCGFSCLNKCQQTSDLTFPNSVQCQNSWHKYVLLTKYEDIFGRLTA